MSVALIAFGANQGNCARTFNAAIVELATAGTITAVSSLHDTTPIGGPTDQPRFVNAAVTLRTDLAPLQLLAELQRIENQLGRVRMERWGPRTIDLDLLLYDDLEIESEALIVPHPRLPFRRFVLDPAVEIAASWRYPINGWTLQDLRGYGQNSPRTLALCGANAAGLSTAVREHPAAKGWEITTRWNNDARCIATFPTAAERSELNERRHQPNSPPVIWLPHESPSRWLTEIIAVLESLGT